MASQLMQNGLTGESLEEFTKNFKETMAEDLKHYTGIDYAAQFKEKMDKLNEFALRNPNIAKQLEEIMGQTDKLDEFLEQHPELKAHMGGNFKDLQMTMLSEVQKMENEMMHKISDGAHLIQDAVTSEIAHAQAAMPEQAERLQAYTNAKVDHMKDEAAELMAKGAEVGEQMLL